MTVKAVKMELNSEFERAILGYSFGPGPYYNYGLVYQRGCAIGQYNRFIFTKKLNFM